ncbi:MAG TPA: hypothetical protein VJO34_16525 [Methylomirabilota bacterium]|nr:hypothetical protein [Methylomirabilota bacterium]
MTYLAIIFVSPLYFALRGKWGAFILNALLYLTALFTVFLFGLGVFFWALAVGHAAWHYRKELMAEHAELIAQKMAEQFRSAPPSTP